MPREGVKVGVEDAWQDGAQAYRARTTRPDEDAFEDLRPAPVAG